jgi:ATP-binding cassette subfamily B protein
MFSVVMFSVIFIMVPRASVSATRINEILETEPDIIDPPNPVFPLRQGLVEFENVSFAYSDSAAKKTLENIRFTAKKGTVTAIIGGTGSGKSTLINLIPRQYDATDGKVKIDGVDVREMSLKDLRSRIGFVAQKAVLFEGNIKDNVLYGADKDNRLKQALEIAQAMNIVEEKEGGYEAVVEQGGRNLSGGQKQRLTIARALATDADILVFDDSFSALDFKTDAMLRKALRENTKDKTVIIVAQRIGTVMDADNIIVLDKGKIVGMGRHEELMERCQEYKDIALSQLSEEELAKGGQANG